MCVEDVVVAVELVDGVKLDGVILNGVVLDGLPLPNVLLVATSLFVSPKLLVSVVLVEIELLPDIVCVVVYAYEVVIREVPPVASVEVIVDETSVTTVAVRVDWPT